MYIHICICICVCARTDMSMYVLKKALNTLFYLGPDHHSKFWTSQIFTGHVGKS